MEHFSAIPKMEIGDVAYVASTFSIERGVISRIDISIHHDKDKTTSECRYDIILDKKKNTSGMVGEDGESVTLYNREEKDIFKSLTEAAIFVLSKYDIVAERSARKDNIITIIED